MRVSQLPEGQAEVQGRVARLQLLPSLQLACCTVTLRPRIRNLPNRRKAYVVLSFGSTPEADANCGLHLFTQLLPFELAVAASHS